MFQSPLARIRRWVGLGCLISLASWVVWLLVPGLPVLSAPSGQVPVREAGLVLFEHDWKPGDSLAGGDGLGPVFNERSCVACHFQGGVGGGGGVKQNVTSFEVHPVPGRAEVMGGDASPANLHCRKTAGKVAPCCMTSSPWYRVA